MWFLYDTNNDILYDFFSHLITMSILVIYGFANIIIILTLSLELLQFRPKIMLFLLNIVEKRLCAYEYNIVCICHGRYFLVRI